jgi:hypothetical protein
VVHAGELPEEFAPLSDRPASVAWSGGGHEDAGAGEGADAHVAAVDLDGGGAVGRRRRDRAGVAGLDRGVLEELEQARGELELLGDARSP